FARCHAVNSGIDQIDCYETSLNELFRDDEKCLCIPILEDVYSLMLMRSICLYRFAKQNNVLCVWCSVIAVVDRLHIGIPLRMDFDIHSYPHSLPNVYLMVDGKYYFNRRFSYASASSQYQVRTPLMKQLATDPSQLGDHPLLPLVDELQSLFSACPPILHMFTPRSFHHT
ncbi:hypothetical protein WA538_002253, partial [Blastocystis sp. DL]